MPRTLERARTLAALHDETADLLAERMRSGLYLTALSIVVFGSIEILVHPPTLPALLAVKLVQIATVCAMLAVLSRPPSWRATVLLGVGTAVEICITLAASGILTNDVASTPLLLIVVTLVTGTFVPWGLWPQLVTVAVAIGALAWNASAVPPPPNFGYSVVAALLAFAASLYVAFGFERHRLVEWVAEEDARQSARELRYEMAVTGTVARVSQEVVAALDAPALVERLCALTVEALGCDASFAFLRDTADGAFVAVAGSGERAERLAWLRSRPVPGMALTSLIDRLRAGEIVVAATASVFDVLPIDAATAVCAALRRGNEVVGILVGAYRTPASVADEPRRVLGGIARIGSMALAQAHLTAELTRANQVEVAFLAEFTREVAEGLAALREAADRAGDAGGAVAAFAFRPLADAISETVLDMLELRSFEAADLHTTAVALGPFWQDLRAICEHLPRRANVTLDWPPAPDVPPVLTDPQKLGAIVRAMVTDALDRTSRGSVDVVLARGPEAVTVRVVDTGSAVAESAESSDPIVSLRRGRGAMRLHLVSRLAHQLGGEVTVAPASGDGSDVSVSLPVRTASITTWRAA
jgi:signal transduction histidine kinase